MITNRATETMSIAGRTGEIADDYALHRDDIRLGVTLALAGVFFAVWFLGYLRQRVGAAEVERGWLGFILLGSGTIGLAGILVYLGILIAATNESIATAPETARTLPDHQLGVRWHPFARIRRFRWGDEPRCPSLQAAAAALPTAGLVRPTARRGTRGERIPGRVLRRPRAPLATPDRCGLRGDVSTPAGHCTGGKRFSPAGVKAAGQRRPGGWFSSTSRRRSRAASPSCSRCLPPGSVKLDLRSRTLAGVTSMHSSSRMNSSACSSDIGRGGIRRTSSSAVDERMFVSFFSFVALTSRSSARVLADDHPLVDLGRRRDEHLAALLQVLERERGRGPAAVGDERSGRSRPQLAVPGLVAVEDVVEDAGAARLGQELGAEADQTACGDEVLEPTQPVPWLTICSSRPLRSASSWVSTPT